jgi:hypothetical protein
MTTELERLEALPWNEKLALSAARLKERYENHPGYAKLAAESGERYWVLLAASNWNAYRLPVLSNETKPASRE